VRTLGEKEGNREACREGMVTVFECIPKGVTTPTPAVKDEEQAASVQMRRKEGKS